MIQETKINTERLSPEFYVWETGYEEVWADKDNPFFVVRNGEMRIHKTNADGSVDVIRYTDALLKLGIENDKQLADWTNQDEELVSVSMNPWYEIYSINDTGYYSEPFFELDKAIAYAEEMLAKYPNGVVAD